MIDACAKTITQKTYLGMEEEEEKKKDEEKKKKSITANEWKLKGKGKDVTDAAAAADEWVGAFQFGRSTGAARGKRQAAARLRARRRRTEGGGRDAYVELRLQERIRREAEVVIPQTTITLICW